MDLSRGLHFPFIRHDKPFARNATHETPNAMRTYICCFAAEHSCAAPAFSPTSHAFPLPPAFEQTDFRAPFTLRDFTIEPAHLRLCEHVCMPLLRILRRLKLLRKITGSMLDINKTDTMILTSCSVLARFIALNAVHRARSLSRGPLLSFHLARVRVNRCAVDSAR
ncbi:hypothetical protein SCHPADRAFT_908821 [Schizopora paradoxa]|uniref:Uncharacterized protein n=1 Tax=Schizopora paradoxa TaxID=27342 RepID=A0A0H2RF38_9AGAM|nr:hypothetical protein SCHPADRAFT_908821 [Schizopora paradoxa]